MIEFAAHLLLTAALLLVIAHLVRGVTVKNWGAAIAGALVLGLINAFVRPLIILVTLPLTLVTLGLFLLVINASMLQLMGMLVPGVRVKGCGSALIGSIVLAILNLVISVLAGSR